MATKKITVSEIKTGAELLNAFNAFNKMDKQKRIAFCKDNGGTEKGCELDTGKARVVFYPETANVWIGYFSVNQKTGERGTTPGKFRSLALNMAHAAYEQWKNKDGKRTAFHHYTWTPDEKLWYTDRNEDLIKALNNAF